MIIYMTIDGLFGDIFNIFFSILKTNNVNQKDRVVEKKNIN